MDAKATRSIRKLALAALLCLPTVATGQGARYDTITFSAAGRPVSANVAVCSSPGLQTTAAQVVSNIAVLTFGSSPITAGFAVGKSLVVTGFSGADTYFNLGSVTPFTSGATILTVSSTTVTYALVHANASATTFGFAFQMGDAVTSCAPIAPIFTDSGLTAAITQPGFTSSGLGNVGFYSFPGSYEIQFYGTGVTTTLQPLTLDPQLVSTIALTGQSASISSTPAFTVSSGAAGNYLVTVSLICTTAGAAGTVGATISWNNGTTAASLSTGPALSLASTGELSAEMGNFYVTGSTQISYLTTVTGGAGSVYAVRIKLEYLGP